MLANLVWFGACLLDYMQATSLSRPLTTANRVEQTAETPLQERLHKAEAPPA
jgi:hypothetical protein